MFTPDYTLAALIVIGSRLELLEHGHWVCGSCLAVAIWERKARGQTLINKSHLLRQAVMTTAAALVEFDKLGTNGYYSVRGVPFGFRRALVLREGRCQRTPDPAQLKASV